MHPTEETVEKSNQKSKEIVDRLGIKRTGQLLLWEDYNNLLLGSKFQSSGDTDFDRDMVAHWFMNVYRLKDDYRFSDDRFTGDAFQYIYHTWDNATYRLFRYARADGSYWTATGQSSVSITPYKYESTEDHIKDLNVWLPYCEPFPADVEHGGDVICNVFERTLSQYAVYRVHKRPDGTWKLVTTKHGTSVDGPEFSDVTSMMSHLQDDFYYQKYHYDNKKKKKSRRRDFSDEERDHG